MKLDPNNLIHSVSSFSARVFKLLAIYNNDKGNVDPDIIKVFDVYEEKPHKITPEIIQATVQCYMDTQDRAYLTEAAILILMLDHKHELETTKWRNIK